MKNLRTYDILSYLRKKKRCTLAELMKKFGVSSATIHRDVLELGGTYDPTLNAMLGEEAMRQLDCFTVTKAFVSSFGVDSAAATTNSERQVGILRKALDTAQRRIATVHP